MSTVVVQKVREPKEMALPLFEEMERLFAEVQDKAFELFEKRGSAIGHELDDWFRAEREVLNVPPAELIEKENEFRLRMATPGLDAKDLQVTAFPDAIIVQAETSAETSKDEQGQGGEVRISEFSARDLFRRVELPAPIDVEKVTATLDKGILKVVAAKAEPALKEKKVFVAAGREAA